jgi:cardiolipin synthase (CMP-forming)
VKYLPNLLSLARLALAPYIFAMLWRREYGLVLLLFAVAGVTDALDGFLARRYSASSRLGAYLDPIADKILLSGSFLTLALNRGIETWVAALVVGRDALILLFACGAFLFFKSRRDFPPSAWGKASTVVQILFILAVTGHFAGFLNGTIVVILKGLTVALTVWSGIDYALRALRESPAQAA